MDILIIILIFIMLVVGIISSIQSHKNLSNTIDNAVDTMGLEETYRFILGQKFMGSARKIIEKNYPRCVLFTLNEKDGD